MIRLILTTWMLLTLVTLSYSQDDTTEKKGSDSIILDTTVTDTIQVHSDTTAIAAISADTTMMVPSPQRTGEVYKLNLPVDIPLTALAAGWSLYAFPKIYDKSGIPLTTLASLERNKQNINGFDRWAADIYHDKAAETSDLFFYASMPLPFLLLLDREIRKDALKVGFLYLEAMSVTGIFYTGCAYVWDRYRPLTYNPNAPIDERRSGNAKNSFLGGHPALVATSTFFIATVYGDYHPNSNFKYVLYSAAAVATGATAYLRHRGGKHFPSDLLVGTAVGTLSGLLVPRLHRNKAYANSKVRVMPFTGQSHGLYVVYKL